MMRAVLYNEFAGYKECYPKDPEGLNQVTKILKRSNENDGVLHEYTLNLRFWEDAREFIITTRERHGGSECHISITLYTYKNYRWRLYYPGKLKLMNYEVDDDYVETSIEQTGFQRKFLNATDQDVSILSAHIESRAPGFQHEEPEKKDPETIDQPEGFILPLHSKTILQMAELRPIDNAPKQFADLVTMEFGAGNKTFYKEAIVYGQISFEDQVVSDLEQTHPTPWMMMPFDSGGSYDEPLLGTANAGNDAQYFTFLSARNKDMRMPVATADFAGEARINISLKLKHEVYARNDGGDVDINGSGALGRVEIVYWLERRNTGGAIVSIDRIGTHSSPATTGYTVITTAQKFTTSKALTLAVGDMFFVYYTVRINGHYEGPGRLASRGYVAHTFVAQAEKSETYARIEVDTVFPGSGARGQLIHEAMDKIVTGVTGVPGSFYSEHFGRTDLGYAADGKGSMRFITNGRNVRGLPANAIYCNWEEIFQAMTSIDCLSWGFETKNGQQIVRVEPKRYFFNPDNLILELGQVSKLKKQNIAERLYSLVDVGYPKIETINQVNGVDEQNSRRKFGMPLTEAKNTLILVSPYRASGFELEKQRRLQGLTEESRLDDENFIVCVMRDGTTYKTEAAENFPVLENVLNPSSVFNASITPGRMVRAWGDYLASLLTYQVNKTLTFLSGTMNYQFISRRIDEVAPFGESDNVNLTLGKPYFVPDRYRFSSEFSDDQMEIVEKNPYGYIKFRDKHQNPKEGYLLKLAHRAYEEQADFELLKVYRPK